MLNLIPFGNLDTRVAGFAIWQVRHAWALGPTLIRANFLELETLQDMHIQIVHECFIAIMYVYIWEKNRLQTRVSLQ